MQYEILFSSGSFPSFYVTFWFWYIPVIHHTLSFKHECHFQVRDLAEASEVFGSLNSILDYDVRSDTVRTPGSLSRNLRRVRQGLDLIRALFQNFLSTQYVFCSFLFIEMIFLLLLHKFWHNPIVCCLSFSFQFVLILWNMSNYCYYLLLHQFMHSILTRKKKKKKKDLPLFQIQPFT